MKILHLITCLDQGGAETVLYRLVSADSESKNHIVISLKDLGFYGQKLDTKGVKVYSLKMHTNILLFFNVFRIILREKPQVIHGWMYHGAIIAWLLGKILGIKKIIFSIHNADIDKTKNSKITILIAKTIAKIANTQAVNCIFVSQKSLFQHQIYGFKKSTNQIISNGIDINEFKYSLKKREYFRGKFNISDKDFLIGCIARWDIYKDHKTLFKAIQLAAREIKINFKCLLAGIGMDENNKELFTLIAEYNLSKTVIPAGLQNDISGLMSCLDLHILSSSAESFGNVIAETMSCGVTNISTDVGEARKIIGDTGIIIPSCDPEGLSKAIITLINDKDLISGSNRANCRKRIEMLYNSWSMLESYKKVWNEI